MGLFDFFKKDKVIIDGVEFPIFQGKEIKFFRENKNTKKYIRKDYYYKYEDNALSSYIPLVNSYGFLPKTDKRFEKNNSYVIVEKLGKRLHVAFQVNK